MPFLAMVFRLPTILGLFLLLVSLAQPHVWAVSLFLSISVRAANMNLNQFRHLSYHQKRLNFLVLVMLLSAFIFSFISADPGRAVSELMQYILIALTVVMISLSFKTRGDLMVVLGFACAGSVVVSICTIGNMLGLWQIDSSSSFISVLPNNYSTTFSLFSGVIAPLMIFLSTRRPKLFILSVVVLVNIASIVITNSRTSDVVLVFTVVAFLWFWREAWRHKKLYMIVICIISIGPLAYFGMQFKSDSIYDANSIFSVVNLEDNTSNLERLALLRTSYEVFTSEPFGLGLGSGDEIFYLNHGVPHPHNTLALFSVEMGVIGILLYFVMLVILLRMLIAGLIFRYESGFPLFIVPLAVILYSIADPIQYNGQYMIVVFIFLALVSVQPRSLIRVREFEV